MSLFGISESSSSSSTSSSSSSAVASTSSQDSYSALIEGANAVCSDYLILRAMRLNCSNDTKLQKIVQLASKFLKPDSETNEYEEIAESPDKEKTLDALLMACFQDLKEMHRTLCEHMNSKKFSTEFQIQTCRELCTLYEKVIDEDKKVILGTCSLIASEQIALYSAVQIPVTSAVLPATTTVAQKGFACLKNISLPAVGVVATAACLAHASRNWNRRQQLAAGAIALTVGGLAVCAWPAAVVSLSGMMMLSGASSTTAVAMVEGLSRTKLGRKHLAPQSRGKNTQRRRRSIQASAEKVNKWRKRVVASETTEGAPPSKQQRK